MNEENIQTAIRLFMKTSEFRKKISLESGVYATERRVSYARKAMKSAEFYGKMYASYMCMFDSRMYKMTPEEQLEVWDRIESRRRVTVAEGSEENPN